MPTYRIYVASNRETTQPRSEQLPEVDADSWMDAALKHLATIQSPTNRHCYVVVILPPEGKQLGRAMPPIKFVNDGGSPIRWTHPLIEESPKIARRPRKIATDQSSTADVPGFAPRFGGRVG